MKILIKREQSHDVRYQSLGIFKERALNFIDKSPDADTCLHGDLHIGNVITDGRRNFWIDLDRINV